MEPRAVGLLSATGIKPYQTICGWLWSAASSAREPRAAATSARWLTGNRCNFFIDVPGPDDLSAEGDFYNHNYTFKRGENIVARSTKEPSSQGFGVDIPSSEDPVLIRASGIVIDLVTRDSGSRGSLFN